LPGVNQAPDILFSARAPPETMQDTEFVSPDVDEFAVVNVSPARPHPDKNGISVR
jgi:hypothetical protein